MRLSGFLVVLCCCTPSLSLAQQDPLEPINRAVFTFNDVLDRILVKPLAKGYRALTPDFVEQGVRNVFSNLGEIRNASNHLLQGQVLDSLGATTRFVVNSTLGLGGFVDVAKDVGLARKKEDFGQTLGRWGVPSGPYLMLPILGPYTLRDAPAALIDMALDPLTYASLTQAERATLVLTNGLQIRADLLDAEALMNGDRYLLIRQAYLSQRAFAISNGRITNDAFVDDGAQFETLDEDGFLNESF